MTVEAITHSPAGTTAARGGFAAPLVAAAVAAAAALTGALAVPSAGVDVESSLTRFAWPALVAVLAALFAGIAVVFAGRGASAAGRPAASADGHMLFDNTAGSSSGAGTRLLASQVVPVWQRQLEASRAEAEQGLGGLLESFNQLSNGLAAAIAVADQGQQNHLGAGAADEIVERRQDLIEQMLAPAQALREFRGEVQAELVALAELLVVLRRTGKDLDTLGRHARLVAMNASIEANRAGQSQAGFGAVAREVLGLATETGGNAQRLLERLSEAEGRLGALRSRLELDTGNAETLTMELQQRARAIVVAIVGDMGDALAGSRELRETSQQLQGALDGVFVGFQFQDRFSQMLGSVLADMTRFVDWLGEGRSATHTDAVAWLKRLDESYTMEQQRSHHHGTSHVGNSPAVEFF